MVAVLNASPLLVVCGLACPLLMIFMMRGMHKRDRGPSDETIERAEPRNPDTADLRVGHEQSLPSLKAAHARVTDRIEALEAEKGEHIEEKTGAV